MKFIKLQVKTILENYPASSDNNSILCRMFYSINYGVEPQHKMAMFFDKLVNKEIPSVETICRLSRHIQEKFPKLRGNEWEKRHGKQEKVKNDLGYNIKK